MATATKINHILINGRTWWRRSYGGTYNTVEVYVDGQFIGKSPKQYGGETLTKQIAVEILVAHGFLTNDQATSPSGNPKPIWQIAANNDFTLTTNIIEVQRERDL